MTGQDFDREDFERLIEEGVAKAVRREVPSMLRQYFELVGLNISSEETRLAIRKDMEAIRSFRTSYDELARRIGRLFLSLLILGAVTLAGIGAWSKIKFWEGP